MGAISIKKLEQQLCLQNINAITTMVSRASLRIRVDTELGR